VVTLSLLMPEAKWVAVCAVADTDATTQTATARMVRKARRQRDELPRTIAGS